MKEIGPPSPGLMARLGVPLGGRVRKTRAVGNSSGPSQDKVNKRAWKNYLELLAAALFGKRRVATRQGWAGEKSGLFEHSAESTSVVHSL